MIESKLNWMTVKPTFEEVKGKKVYVENTDGIFVFNKDMDSTDYLSWFRYDFLRFAIIAEPEIEPMMLWGEKPEIVNMLGSNYFRYGAIDTESIQITTKNYPTRSEAITAWNKIAKALEEVVL